MKQFTLDNYPLPDGYRLEDYNPKILDKCLTRFQIVLNAVKKVLMVRLDVRFPADLEIEPNETLNNECFQYFREEYMRKISRGLLGFVWAREQAHSDHCHWHIVIFFDQSVIHFYGYPFAANLLWAKAIKKFYDFEAPTAGLIEVAPDIRNGLVVPNENDAMIEEALRIMSYIAKLRTKGNAPHRVREYGASYVR